MYESPIEIIEGVTNHVMKETEDGIVCEIRKQLGFNIDKEELTKALRYDRHQYERGYADGKNHTTEWIPVSESLPENRNLVLVTAYWHETYQVMVGSYWGNGVWWCAPWNNTSREHLKMLNAVAWMPLPKPYEEGEDR